jgi:hypothetical protein
MMPNQTVSFYERLSDLLSDWTAYYHDIQSDLRRSRLYVEMCTPHEKPEYELRLMKNVTRNIKAADILVALEIIAAQSPQNTRMQTISSLIMMFEKANDEYLNCIIDYNLIADEVTKVEFAATIEVLRTFIADMNNLNVNGD